LRTQASTRALSVPEASAGCSGVIGEATTRLIAHAEASVKP